MGTTIPFGAEMRKRLSRRKTSEEQLSFTTKFQKSDLRRLIKRNFESPRLESDAPKSGLLNSSSKLPSVERVTPEFLDAIRSKGRTTKIVEEGAEDARYPHSLAQESW